MMLEVRGWTCAMMASAVAPSERKQRDAGAAQMSSGAADPAGGHRTHLN
jgi:hypothetical protein